jgi:hypothetical protein
VTVCPRTGGLCRNGRNCAARAACWRHSEYRYARTLREAFPAHHAPRSAPEAAYRAPGLKAWLSRLLREL